jgi:hypothetical protein
MWRQIQFTCYFRLMSYPFLKKELLFTDHLFIFQLLISEPFPGVKASLWWGTVPIISILHFNPILLTSYVYMQIKMIDRWIIMFIKMLHINYKSIVTPSDSESCSIKERLLRTQGIPVS